MRWSCSQIIQVSDHFLAAAPARGASDAELFVVLTSRARTRSGSISAKAARAGFRTVNAFQRSRPSQCQRTSSPPSSTSRTSTGKMPSPSRPTTTVETYPVPWSEAKLRDPPSPT